MKTIFKGDKFVIQWSITDVVTSLPFDFTGMFVEYILYSDSYKGRISAVTTTNNKMQVEIPGNVLPYGIYNIVCKYRNSVSNGHCIYRRAFQITRNPEFSTCDNTVVIESFASPLKMENMDINYLGHFPSEELLPDCNKPSWALVGSLKEAHPWFFYTAGSVPPGYQAGWNDLNTALGIYDLTEDKVSIYDFSLITEYNVSRNHEKVERLFSPDWGVTKRYCPEHEEFCPCKEYYKGDFANMPNYTENSFIALRKTSEPPFIITGRSSEFSFLEALSYVPKDYRFPGIRITFVNKDTHQAETWFFLSGDWNEKERWIKPISDVTINNLPDNEDISTTNESVPKLRFNDKNYDKNNFSGLGRCYLRKNMVGGVNVLTQEMFVDKDGNPKGKTRYIIQYDYDLNGSMIYIPEECILVFEGGSIRNGTLSGEFCINSVDVKIFDNVKFEGACVNRFFRTDWFVGSYSSSLDINDPSDATAELQQMFDSGIQKVFFCNNHYYKITDTIIVDAKIAIDGVRQRDGYSNKSLNKSVFGSFDKPFVIIKAKSGETVTSSTINNLYLYRYQRPGSISEANSFKRDIPTLYVDCTEGNIWGLYIWAIIEINPVSSVVTAADGETTFNVSLGGYRGFEIYAANKHYASYITIDGYLHDFYEGIKIHKDQTSSWITAITLKYDSEGCYGGYVCHSTILEGQHQTRHYLPKNEDAFFDIDGVCMVNGAYIWDIQYDTAIAFPDNEIQSTRYSIKATNFVGGIPFNGCVNKINNRLMKVELDYYGLKGEARKEANILADAFYGMNYQKFVNNVNYNNLSEFVCEVVDEEGNTIPVTEDNTYGYSDLFYPERLSMDDVIGTPKTFNSSRVTYVKGVSVKEYHFAFKATFFNRVALILHCFSSSIDKYIITVDGKETVLNRPSRVQFYNPYYFEIKYKYGCQVDVRVVYRTAQTEVNLPFIGLCGDSAGEMIGPWGGSVYGPLVCREITSSSPNQRFVRYLGGRNIDKFIGDSWGTYTYLTFKQQASPIYPVIIRFVDRRFVITMHINSAEKKVNCMVNGYFRPDWLKVLYKEDSNTGFVTWQISGTAAYNMFIDEVVCRGALDFTEVEDVSDFTAVKPNYIGGTITINSSSRPAYNNSDYNIGVDYFDSTIKKPIWWSGEKWIEADGTPAVAKKGSTEDRPNTLIGSDAGYQYFDTTINKPIYWTGSVWVDATGASV